MTKSEQHTTTAGFQRLQEYVMLTQWLADTENKLPPNATHQVGIGALVINDQQEVLVVQEISGPLKGQQVWKMPTGLVMQQEDLSDAAEREVLEETGVKAKYVTSLQKALHTLQSDVNRTFKWKLQVHCRAGNASSAWSCAWEIRYVLCCGADS
jgi:8-oxo-dGTP pyrophosphatase MutT (NUDIX family)